MKIKNLLCLVAAVGFIAPALSHGQSLTEVAKREKLRRAKIRAGAGTSKLYTDGDRAGTAGDSSEAAAAPDGTTPVAVAGGAKKKEKSQDEMAAEKQKEWSEKVQKAQDEIKNLEAAIARNERALASMYNITPARADMINSIDSDKKKVGGLKQALANLEDERRRSGMARPR